ncbi:endonuclease V [Nucisporomicrobium flavum]|uniref:endonuclease V n=1 Tax=Nucisporomicrobium flavum TaxID=2785915 RepID=UPI0018F48FE0|nr:endonuclease V [Nucisporomicrobium flavum]
MNAPAAWPRTEAEALAAQDALRSRLLPGPGPEHPRAVAGLDVAYHEDGERLAAAVVVLDAGDHRVLDTAVVRGTAAFPYVPGLFAFREIPALRTRTGVKPVFVSVGHRSDLDAACALTLGLASRFRLPETTRLADRACRDALAVTAPRR